MQKDALKETPSFGAGQSLTRGEVRESGNKLPEEGGEKLGGKKQIRKRGAVHSFGRTILFRGGRRHQKNMREGIRQRNAQGKRYRR